MSRVSRSLLGVILLGAAIGFGAAARSPLVVLPLALIFAVAFALGRWRGWQAALRNGSFVSALRGQWQTLLAQLLLVGVLYLLGRGLGALMAPDLVASGFDATDRLALFGLAIVAVCGGAGLALAEARMPAVTTAPQSPRVVEFKLVDFVPVNDETFFAGHHFSNTVKAKDGSTQCNPALAYLTKTQIADAESRLGIALPPHLRRLYLRQNGGSMGGLVAARGANPGTAESDWLYPFSGYDDLNPLRSVRSLKDSIEDYASFDDQPEMFPSGADRMIILAQWYRETLFLDYRNGAPPRVGFFDFDASPDLQDPEWESRAHWWPDFETFFAGLRRPPQGWPA